MKLQKKTIITLLLFVIVVILIALALVPNLNLKQSNQILKKDDLIDETKNNVSEEKVKRESEYKSTSDNMQQSEQMEQLDTAIQKDNEELHALMEQYNEDLSNKENKQALSKALRENQEYKNNVLQKFKMEQKTKHAE